MSPETNRRSRFLGLGWGVLMMAGLNVLIPDLPFWRWILGITLFWVGLTGLIESLARLRELR